MTITRRTGDDGLAPAVRLAVHLRDEFRCGYCSRDLRSRPPGNILLERLERLAPQEAEPADTPATLLTVCRDCQEQRIASRLSWRHWLMMEYGAVIGPAVIRAIDQQRQKPLNLDLARAILSGEVGEVLPDQPKKEEEEEAE